MKRKNIIIIICIVLSVCVSLSFLYFNNVKVIFNDLNVSINEKVSNLSFIKEVKGADVISDEEVIDTSKIGKYKVNIILKTKLGKKKKYSFYINIKDENPPVINKICELETYIHEEIDLLKCVNVQNNSLQDVDVKVVGEYDFNKEGIYKIYYEAKDLSGNETKEEGTLIVKKKEYNMEDRSFKTSKGFDAIIKDGILYVDGYLIANKSYSLPKTYGNGLTEETLNAFYKMKDAAKEENLNIYISSGFRSYDTQKSIYNGYVNRDGKEEADTYSARAGHSEHQSGLAFDVNDINESFQYTDEAKWLSKNAYKYGFILRYPKGKTNETGYIYESWHLRYVGVELASKLYNNEDWITMEDYFGITSIYD